ncbi:hypothetical protein NMG60_11003172 [Bertholletia excelsa]
MMDIGMVGLDGLVASVSVLDSSCFASSLVLDPETKQQWYGSDLFLTQERSSSSSSGPAAEADLRSLKVAKTDEFFSASKAMLFQQQRSNSNVFFLYSLHS